MRYAPAGHGDQDAFPDVGAEEGGGDVGVLEGEEGRGEGFQSRPLGLLRCGCEAEDCGGGGGEVDELGYCFSGYIWEVDRAVYSLVCDDCFAVAAFDGEGFFAGE